MRIDWNVDRGMELNEKVKIMQRKYSLDVINLGWFMSDSGSGTRKRACRESRQGGTGQGRNDLSSGQGSRVVCVARGRGFQVMGRMLFKLLDREPKLDKELRNIYTKL